MKNSLAIAIVFFILAGLVFASMGRAAVEEDKKLHFAVGFGLGAGASTLGHLTMREHDSVGLYVRSIALASVIYVGKELSDEEFSVEDLAYDYAGHTVGYWIMVPVNNLLFGSSAYQKHALSTDGRVVMYTRRW